MAFGFGLVHGLGLSNVLRDLGLSGRELLPALLGFNVGVEIGQLAIVAPMFVLVLRLRRNEAVYSRSRNLVCAAVAIAAAFWLVVRIRDAFLPSRPGAGALSCSPRVSPRDRGRARPWPRTGYPSESADRESLRVRLRSLPARFCARVLLRVGFGDVDAGGGLHRERWKHAGHER